jgi:hypothetical protein
MSNSRFNTVFGAMVMGALLCALVIPTSLTDRASKRADLLLTPVAKPARAIASMFSRRWGEKPLPPGETARPTDQTLALENSDLKQQVAFLSSELAALRLVEEERKRLGPLLQYFKPVSVIGGDTTAGRESLSVIPTSGGEFAPGSPVMCPEGLVGRLTDARRVRLVTDPGYKITAAFVRWADGGVWKPIDAPKGACTGIGNNTVRIDNLTLKESEVLRPGDWVTVADLTDYPDLIQGRPFAQIKTIRPLAAKPLFAEIIAEPRVDLRKLREVMVMRK